MYDRKRFFCRGMVAVKTRKWMTLFILLLSAVLSVSLSSVPQPVTDLVIQLSTNQNDVLLSWSQPQFADSFQVHSGDSCDFQIGVTTLIGTTPDTNFTHLNALVSMEKRFYVVIAIYNGLEPVDLRTAADFAILAGSTVTSTGFTIVNGDLGVSPGTAVDGFPPGVVNGMIHAGDPIAAQAKLDLTTAYNDAAGRTTAPITISGNLGGQTLPPGLYKSTSTLEISSGDLTLDAEGDENAVWIFQIASTLTTTTGRQVTLIGNAQAGNIYWQVGSSATLGTYSVFKGNLLADQSITITIGATLEGRALTRIGAVTLDNNIITMPTP